jgi:NADH-quinone oxidoreductase subunit J
MNDLGGMNEILFFLFSGAMLVCAVLVIINRNPVNSAMLLVLVFFFMAALFVLLHAYLLAAIQVLVYAGAVMVLFLFVIMLLNIKSEVSHRMHWFGIAGAIVVIPLLMFEFYYLVSQHAPATSIAEIPVRGTTKAVGQLLFTEFLLPFEVASLLLLAAMIGVIVLGQKDKEREEPGS